MLFLDGTKFPWRFPLPQWCWMAPDDLTAAKWRVMKMGGDVILSITQSHKNIYNIYMYTSPCWCLSAQSDTWSLFKLNIKPILWTVSFCHMRVMYIYIYTQWSVSSQNCRSHEYLPMRAATRPWGPPYAPKWAATRPEVTVYPLVTCADCLPIKTSTRFQVDGSTKKRHNSSASALELRLFYVNPSNISI